MIAQGTYGLTDLERGLFDEQGYFVRQDAFTHREMDVLRNRIDDLVNQVEASTTLTDTQKQSILRRNEFTDIRSGPASLNSIIRLHHFSAMVRTHIRDPRRLEPAVDLVGPDLFCPNDLYFFKPPGTGRPIDWHQDSWYFRNTYISSEGDSIDEASIGTWLALEDADEENGCFWVIPGSQQAGVVYHTQVEEEGYLLQKKVNVTEEMEARGIPVEVPKGALVFFNNALLHMSTPNHSDRFRRAYIVHYMKATIKHIRSNNNERPKARDGWGSSECYVCGSQLSGCVETTDEEKCLDWDAAMGRELTEEEITVAD